MLTRPLKGRYIDFPSFRPGGLLLEIGCAKGERMAMLRGLGWKVRGVEISPEACRLARDQYGLEVFCGELEEAGLPDASVDAVLMSHLIEHVHDPIATLREVRRILRPGGVVVMETPNVRSLEQYVFRQYWYDWDVPRHLFLFSARTLAHCCARAGLRVTRVGYSSYAGDWIRSLAYWCLDHQWRRVGQWLHGRPRALTLLLAPLCKLLVWVGATGRMTVVAARQ
jgi:SAM-dependent methyltransferase